MRLGWVVVVLELLLVWVLFCFVGVGLGVKKGPAPSFQLAVGGVFFVCLLASQSPSPDGVRVFNWLVPSGEVVPTSHSHPGG